MPEVHGGLGKRGKGGRGKQERKRGGGERGIKLCGVKDGGGSGVLGVQKTELTIVVISPLGP